MKTDELDKGLRELAAQPMPAPQPNLLASVLREIRQRQRRVTPFEWIGRLFWVPQAAFAVVPVAVAVGVMVAFLAPAPHAEARATRGLYLEVFSQYSPTLPSTYLSSRL